MPKWYGLQGLIIIIKARHAMLLVWQAAHQADLVRPPTIAIEINKRAGGWPQLRMAM
jgi:hypothetical protein